MRERINSAIIVISLLISCVLVSDCSSPESTPAISSTDDLIAAHVSAIGGMEKLKSLKTRTTYGVYEEAGFKQNHRFDEKRPNLIRITTNYNRETGTFGYCEGFDGAAWEYSFKVPVRVTGMPETALKNASDFDEPFIDYQYKGHTVEWKGRTRFLGQDVYQLRIGRSDYFFDAESFMLTMSRIVAPFHGEGKEEEIISINSDFRPIEGVLMAHQTVQKAHPSGEIKSTFTCTEIQGNVEIPDAWFGPPPSQAQQRYGQFRQIALDGDLDKLSSSYLDYKGVSRSQLHQRWENELNTLGYELISHERYQRAILVFKLAIENFPKSANLYDSLGEAYMLAGDNQLSIKNYSRSLELNPNNDHAVKLLEKLRRK